MTVCVYGLWHLGSVTAACLASVGHHVIGLDPDARVVRRLADGSPPIFEPGLEGLTRDGLASGALSFTADLERASAADVLWVTIDTPVDDDDRGDADAVVSAIERLFPYLRHDSLVLVSSQVPVGTTRRLEERFAAVAAGRCVGFAYSPENLRLGVAIDAFMRPERIVIGVRTPGDRQRLTGLLQPFGERVEWMSVESAEMTKHALNAFLAASIAFANEIAVLCEQVGADAADVQRGLTSDVRIGPRAYLSPGSAFAGGTLARDVTFLADLGSDLRVPTHLISGVLASNDAHRRWEQRRLAELLGELSGATVAVWGLTYKPGTDTLRRSSAVALCRWLTSRGATVRAHDPAVFELPDDLRGVQLASDPLDALTDADALVVATGWPVYREVAPSRAAERLKGDLVLDAAGALVQTLGAQPGLRYLRVGAPAA